jgi:heme oxygenase
MTAPGHALLSGTNGATDDGGRVADDGNVLRRLRSETAREHEAVERVLDLLAADLTKPRLVKVLSRLHGFWRAAEGGLDAWAEAHPAAAADVAWFRRRRAHLYATDLAALGASPNRRPGGPELPAVADTDAALGRLYVLEGSTLGGVFIDRHLASLPWLAHVSTLSAFSPYGPETGAMWHRYRQVTRARVAAGGNADRLVAAARDTFEALATWCGAPAPGQAGWCAAPSGAQPSTAHEESP